LRHDADARGIAGGEQARDLSDRARQRYRECASLIEAAMIAQVRRAGFTGEQIPGAENSAQRPEKFHRSRLLR
jgi:hypothetical protein